ncbi:MAG: CDP-diacylglycerol--glycerol-3-phosphate 3-phosphatidyltransferase [Deltaproteobacteria bacterium]|nr:CDP-diacylglycerol--glycerol-3-phosphate 3-phosphatidyltransferase [Deltaproteobacteria bacterium]
MERTRARKPLTTDQLLGIANYLTYGRIVIVIIVVFLMMMMNDHDPDRILMTKTLSWICMVLVTIAGISDAVDGYYARKYGVVSSFGKFLDPLADKLLSMSVLIMLLSLGRVPAWIVVLLVARDVTITAVRSMAAAEGIEIAASWWGKRKTLIQTIALGFLLVHHQFYFLNPHAVGMGLLWVTLFVSIGSALHYITGFFSEVLTRKKGGDYGSRTSH